jgi:hypothetical protein
MEVSLMGLKRKHKVRLLTKEEKQSLQARQIYNASIAGGLILPMVNKNLSTDNKKNTNKIATKPNEKDERLEL